ncbi:MAG: topoisomerase C-terminal repeat-containing protein, partial [Planctomycetota bacterium]
TVIETPTHFACNTRISADETQAAYKEARRLARERKEPMPAKPEPPPHPGMLLPRTVCKREITRDEAMVYLSQGKTDLLPEFTSRFGRPFSATLVLKENGRHGFEFPPRGEGAGKKAAAGKGKKKTGDEAPAKPRKAAARRKKTTRRKSARKGTARKKTARKGTSRKGAARKGTATT